MSVDENKEKWFLKGVVRRTAFFLALFIFLELIFHLFTIGSGFEYLPMKFIAVLPTVVLFAMLTMLLPVKAGNIIEIVLLALSIFYYVVNLMYKDAFQVFFSIHLINTTNTKILQYYREIIESLKRNALAIAICILVPVPLYFVFRKRKFFSSVQVPLKRIYVPIISVIISIVLLVSVGIVYGLESYSPIKLITGDNILEFSMARLGVMPTTEIEIKNLFLPASEDVEEFDVWVYEPKDDYAETLDSSIEDGNQDNQVVDLKINADNNIDEGKEDELLEEVPEPEIIIDTSPNILDLDFVSMAESAPNKEVENVHRYFASVEPSYKNEYTGMFEGYNLIFLTAEAFCPLAVDEELTPTLYKLVNEGFVFNNFYNPRTGGSTSDGEFVCSTSLVPTNGGATNFRIVGQNSMPQALGNMFNMKYGITSRAYHDNDYTYYDRHKTYPGMGYYYKARGCGLDIPYHWPESDLDMMVASIPEYIDDDIFHVYYMTVSGHMNYNFGGNYMSLIHKSEVDDLPYSTACKAYIACQMEFDRAMEYLINALEEKGIADKTVICFTGDHWPYGLTDEEFSEILGHEVEPDFELFKSNLVLWSGSIEEPIIIDKPCCSMDILPTLLNLFGFDFDSRLLMGRDILSDTDGFVMFINRSFLTDKVMYNSQTGKSIWLTEEEVPEDYIDSCKDKLNNKFKYSQKIMDLDYYKYICEELNIDIPVIEQPYGR